MRGGLAQFVLVIPAWLLCQMPQLHAQETSSTRSASDCQSPRTSHAERVHPQVSVAEVNFIGDLHLPIEDRDEVVSSIKQLHQVNDIVDEALERVRYGWENHGYFKVHVQGEAKILSANSRGRLVALDVRVDEGQQYRLSGISFQRNHAISDVATLRSFFPINDGDVLSREKIATGLENLRKAYAHLGYRNFTAVPGTGFDDVNQSIYLVIDLDEGKRFHIGSVNVWGLDEASATRILNAIPTPAGGVYDSQLYEAFLMRYASMMPECTCERALNAIVTDARTGMVTINLDFRPCSDN